MAGCAGHAGKLGGWLGLKRLIILFQLALAVQMKILIFNVYVRVATIKRQHKRTGRGGKFSKF